MGVQIFKPMDLSKISPMKALHYKGGRYEVLGTGNREADGVRQVIYRDIHGEIWIRPLQEFVQYVTNAEGESVPRFTLYVDGANAPACVPLEALTNPESAS